MRSSFQLGLLILAVLTLKLGEFEMLIKLNGFPSEGKPDSWNVTIIINIRRMFGTLSVSSVCVAVVSDVDDDASVFEKEFESIQK